MANWSLRTEQPVRPFAAEWPARAWSADCSPRDNRILAALPQAVFDRLSVHLERVALAPGSMLIRRLDQASHLYFPVSGLVSRLHHLASGSMAEFATTGREGVIGATSLPGGAYSVDHVVMVGGQAFRLQAGMVHSEALRTDPLPRLLLLYTQVLMTQIAQVAACNRHHSIDAQLCRKILSTMDRLGSRQLPLTHEQLSAMLGVRRESVSQSAGTLQQLGVIHYSRGHIEVLDRRALEARTCECYWVVKREYERLLPEHSSLVTS